MIFELKPGDCALVMRANDEVEFRLAGDGEASKTTIANTMLISGLMAKLKDDPDFGVMLIEYAATKAIPTS